jgi:hypothetical protein
MKKFLLSLIFLNCLFFSQAQLLESFNSGILPAGWDLANGMQVNSYNNPVNNCAADFGLQTPGIGGNNPAKVLTPVNTFSTAAAFINVGFSIYIFDANLNCASVKPLPCQTFVRVYLVKSTVTTATIPPAADILAQSTVQIVQSNTSNILFVPTPGMVSGTQYRVLYDFSVDGNCNQGGTKYIIDEFRVVTTSGGPLPVELKNFNAGIRNGKSVLTWETDQENNNKGFEIHRRTGNGKYETIGFVATKANDGNSGSTLSYQFTDASVLAKTTAYYRLRQVDVTEKSTYSDVRLVRFGGSQVFVSVYPNPGRGATNVSIPANAGKLDIALTDFAGKIIQDWNDVSISNLQLANLKAGVYILRIHFRETGEQLTERIVIQ